MTESLAIKSLLNFFFIVSVITRRCTRRRRQCIKILIIDNDDDSEGISMLIHTIFYFMWNRFNLLLGINRAPYISIPLGVEVEGYCTYALTTLEYGCGSNVENIAQLSRVLCTCHSFPKVQLLLICRLLNL